MVRAGYLWHGLSCEVALQVKHIKRKGHFNTLIALAFDDNHPSYEMAKPSKVCDVHTKGTHMNVQAILENGRQTGRFVTILRVFWTHMDHN